MMERNNMKYILHTAIVLLLFICKFGKRIGLPSIR